MGFGFYGVPDLCERVEGGLEPMFIGFDEANAYLPEGAWLARQFPRARIVFRANNQVAQAIAARAGARDLAVDPAVKPQGPGDPRRHRAPGPGLRRGTRAVRGMTGSARGRGPGVLASGAARCMLPPSRTANHHERTI